MAVTKEKPAPPCDGTLESALYAEDLNAAETFYSGILGLSVQLRQAGRHVFFRAGGSILLVFDPAASARGAPPGGLPVPVHGARGPGHWCMAVPADSLDRWRAHLEGHGVKIEADFQWPNGARSIYVRDPAGNSIELAPRGLWFGA